MASTLCGKGGGFFIMKQFVIKSPTGNKLMIQAYDIFHACNMAVLIENFVFTNQDYLHLNK